MVERERATPLWQSGTRLSIAGDRLKALCTSQEDDVPLIKLKPPPSHTHTHCFTSPPKQHCVYDRPGHVPLRQTRAEGWVLKDGKVLEDMGATEG